MPLRQGDFKKVLRGEDAAFLREAACRVSYLTYSTSNYSPWNQGFTVDTGPNCGGVCNQWILATPLKYANSAFRTQLKFYAAEMIGSSDVFVWDTSAFPPLSWTLPEVLSVDIDPSVIPNYENDFDIGEPLRQQPIEELVNCVSAFVYPTRRGGYAQNAWATGSSEGDWSWNGEQGNSWIDYSGPYGPDAGSGAKFPNGHPSRQSLEGIYSSAVYYGPNNTYTGWATA